MFDSLRQEGIVLKKIPYGEADEIVTVLLREDGLRRLFAAGSRKSKKRFGGLIDAFARLSFDCRPSETGLWRLRAVAEPEHSVPRVPERDLGAYAFFNYLAELICECTPEAVRAGDVFSIWTEAVEMFEARGFDAGEAFAILIRAWAAFGYEMSLKDCASCGARAGEGALFIPRNGGLTCAACARAQGAAGADPALPSQGIESLASFSHLILQKRPKAEEFFLKSIA